MRPRKFVDMLKDCMYPGAPRRLVPGELSVLKGETPELASDILAQRVPQPTSYDILMSSGERNYVHLILYADGFAWLRSNFVLDELGGAEWNEGFGTWRETEEGAMLTLWSREVVSNPKIPGSVANWMTVLSVTPPPVKNSLLTQSIIKHFHEYETPDGIMVDDHLPFSVQNLLKIWRKAFKIQESNEVRRDEEAPKTSRRGSNPLGARRRDPRMVTLTVDEITSTDKRLEEQIIDHLRFLSVRTGDTLIKHGLAFYTPRTRRQYHQGDFTNLHIQDPMFVEGPTAMRVNSKRNRDSAPRYDPL
jgi:hypothetical protein